MSDIKIGTLVAGKTSGANKIVFGHVIKTKDVRYIVSWDNGFEEIYSLERLMPFVKLVEELKNS